MRDGSLEVVGEIGGGGRGGGRLQRWLKTMSQRHAEYHYWSRMLLRTITYVSILSFWWEEWGGAYVGSLHGDYSYISPTPVS